MEIRPIPESPDEVSVQYRNRIEYEHEHPHPFRRGLRRLLAAAGFVEPLEFPHAEVYQLSAFRNHHNRMVDRYGFWEGDGIGSVTGESEFVAGMRRLNRQVSWQLEREGLALERQPEDSQAAA